MIYKLKNNLFLFAGLAILASGCYETDVINADVKQAEPPTDELDIYIQENFVQPYNVAVRYAFVDRLVGPDKRVTPPKREVVVPMLEFLADFWIDPFLNVENGEVFFKRHVPKEVVLIGSTMYNSDGTVTLGTADAGARITLTEVNFVNADDISWVFRQLGTIYHEFAHIVHQRYDLPPNFQTISPTGYTSAGSWYNLTDEDALRRGFVSPYGTSSFNEDFAEIVAKALYDPLFYEKYIDDETCATPACLERNEGRALIRKKFNAILAHYEQSTGVDLLAVRELIQTKYQ